MESHGLTAMVPPYPPAADLSAFRDLRHQPKQKYSFFPVHSSCRIQPHGWRGAGRRAHVGEDVPRGHDGGSGVRPAVRFGELGV